MLARHSFNYYINKNIYLYLLKSQVYQLLWIFKKGGTRGQYWMIVLFWGWFFSDVPRAKTATRGLILAFLLQIINKNARKAFTLFSADSIMMPK